jgi:hypothetical protein
VGNTRNLKAVETQTKLWITVSDLNDEAFYKALQKIDDSRGALTGKKAWSFADFKAACDKIHAGAQQKYNTLCAQHVETETVMQPDHDGIMAPARDESGMEIRRPKVVRDGQGKILGYVFKDPAAFAKARDDLMRESFHIPLTLLTTDELTGCGLTPKEMRAIRKLISDAPPEPSLDMTPEAVSS